MSLITRCPACGTLFKVVPDQLRISDGWVRCGQCEEVFDGNANLQSASLQPQAQAAPVPDATPPEEASPEEAPSSAIPEAPVNPPGTGRLGPAAAPQDYDWGDVIARPSETQNAAPEPGMAAGSAVGAGSVADPEPDLEPKPDLASATPAQAEWEGTAGAFAPEADPVLQAAPATALAEPAWDEARPAPAMPAVAPGELNISALGSLSELEGAQGTESLRYVQADTPLPAPVQDPRPSFMVPKASRRRSRAEQWTLGLLATILLVTLAGQWLLHERDRLAALQPTLKPALQSACELLGCVVSAPRQIETLVIESSSFTKIRGDIYRLGFAIRNPGSMELAVPAMELTLTDSQDRVLLKKVLLAQEFSKPVAIDAGAESSITMAVQLKLGAQGERVAGYRLLAFYP